MMYCNDYRYDQKKKVERAKGFGEMKNTYKILVRKLERKIIWEISTWTAG